MKTLDEIKARAAEIATELETLDAAPEWSDEQRAQHTALNTELTDLDARKADILARAEIRAKAAKIANTEYEVPTVRVAKSADDAFDLRTLSFASGDGEIRARALTAIEKMPEVPDYIRQQASKIVGKLPAVVARRVLLTGSQAYRTAYQKAMVGMSMLWTEEERDAFRAALSLSDSAGGYAVPFNLDPTIISTKDVTTNPYRRISRVVTGVTDNWNGITTAGVTASFDAEAAEVSDDSPSLSQPSVTAHMARAFARGSIEISGDWAGIENDLRVLFQEAKDDLEGSKFTTGSGTNEPFGIVTALDDGTSEVDPATAETFAVADVYALMNALPPKYRLATLNGDATESRASWLAEVSTYNKIRQFDTGGGAGLWEYLGGGRPAKLLGFNAYEASGMRGFGDIDTAATAENPILILGDFRNYLIYDRVGFNLEFIPHLFHTSNNLPSGQRGWFAYWRVGADSINDGAFRMLDVDTAA